MQRLTGVLLINLGTPDAPSYRAVRRYLREFLSDSRVIERQGWRWRLILNAIILPRRAREFSHSYSLIWGAGRDGSPLKSITRAQAEKAAARFAGDENIVLDWAMRYGNPPIEAALARLTGAGCTQVLIFPLYPQYSAATTATAMDKVHECLAGMRRQPALRTVPPYFDDPAYIGALAGTVQGHHRALGWTPEATVLSFHGLPRAFVDKGDPYRQHCERTAALIREALGADETSMPLAYQSGSGRPGWLGPNLEETLVALARLGIRRLSVLTPGFAADCIETLEEVEIRAARVFLNAGGTDFALVPCLNDSAPGIDLLCQLIDRNLAGWTRHDRSSANPPG